jgi:hypothetical protein
MPREGKRKQALNQPVNWIELACSWWEDYNWLYYINNLISLHFDQKPVCSNTNSVVNAPLFRDYLLRVHTAGAQNQWEIFRSPDDFPSDQKILVARIPFMVCAWVEKSQRIYKLNPGLQALLQATSLKGVNWKDVRLPHDSFAIELTKPFIDLAGGSYEMALVSSNLKARPEDPPTIDLMFMGTAPGSPRYQPITQGQKARIEMLLDRGRYIDAARETNDISPRLKRFWITGFSFQQSLDEPVTQTAEKVYRKTFPNLDTPAALQSWDELVSITMGLVMYLRTLPNGSPHLSQPNKVPPGTPDRKLITDRWRALEVTPSIPLTPQEFEYYGIGKPSSVKCIHHRRGYWSRPPGKGDDPDAEKSVWHRPTIVNRAKLPENGGLPQGRISEDSAD